VGSNLFGDILSDLGPPCTERFGIAPIGHINPERKFFGVRAGARARPPTSPEKNMEPHRQMLVGPMMLSLGHKAGDAIVRAIERVLTEGPPRGASRQGLDQRRRKGDRRRVVSSR